jgi:hypothetical protein
MYKSQKYFIKEVVIMSVRRVKTYIAGDWDHDKDLKLFILIVGKHTNKLKKGICSFCKHYNKKRKTCSIDNDVDKRSYIKYECDKAFENDLKIIVIYKDYKVERKKCPKILREEGTHIPAYTLTKKSPQSIKIDKNKFLNFPEIVAEIA